MRILLYTGKGGVGKTSAAAATALRCADLGYRTIVVSTDSAHSLADSFDIELGPEPVQITENLWGQELDALQQTEKHVGSIKRYAASVFSAQGLQRIVAEELTVLPGLEEVISLVQIVRLHDAGTHDVVVMDCAPTGATLQLLAMPEAGRWYLQKILPLEKRLYTLVKPLLRAVTNIPIPEQEVYQAMETLIGHLKRMHELLTNPEISSARLVMNAEKMVIKETRRAYMYLSLYGYTVDALICNRLLPTEAAQGYLSEWHDIQQRYRQTIEESFAPLPVLDVPLFDREVVGIDMLRRMGEAIFRDHDPAAVLHAGGRQQVIETDEGFALRVPLPVPSGTIQLNRTASDELIVHIGNRRRILSLPHTLAAMKIRGARHQDNTLHVDFAPAGAD